MTAKPLVLTLLVVFTVTASPLLRAQAGQAVMTNRQVMGLVKLGVPDDTIVLSIRGGPTDFDLSDSALRQLKDNGV